MSQSLDLTIMLADYHRTRPLLAGEVTAKGINLQPRRAESGEACMRPVYEEFDIAEMSLSWYMMARSRNEPVVALPIFPLRMQIHPYIFCSASSGNRTSGRLEGQKNRHGRISTDRRPVGERNLARILRRAAAGLRVVYFGTRTRRISAAGWNKD